VKLSAVLEPAGKAGGWSFAAARGSYVKDPSEFITTAAPLSLTAVNGAPPAMLCSLSTANGLPALSLSFARTP
jgi:hypothetical protein